MATILTRELVNRYIESAQPFAQSKEERLAIEAAELLNSPPRRYSGGAGGGSSGVPPLPLPRRRRRNPFDESDYVAEREVTRWQTLALREIHIALCSRSTRYRKYVEIVRDNANMLIGGIAFRVAQTLGVAVAVVAALVAALLRWAFAMGVSVFCKRFAARSASSD